MGKVERVEIYKRIGGSCEFRCEECERKLKDFCVTKGVDVEYWEIKIASGMYKGSQELGISNKHSSYGEYSPHPLFCSKKCAEKFVKAVKSHEFSIDSSLLDRKFTDKKGYTFTLKDRLVDERLALKRKDDISRFEIIPKSQMKDEIGHSPDFIEGWFMVMHLMEHKRQCVRKGFGAYGC